MKIIDYEREGKCKTKLIIGNLYSLDRDISFFWSMPEKFINREIVQLCDEEFVMPIEVGMGMLSNLTEFMFTAFLTSRGRLLSKANWEINQQITNFRLLR